MNASLLAMLTDAERLIVAETEPAALAELDEDSAIALEARIRRTRNKYTGQYRRAAATRVSEHGGRGAARPLNTRAVLKAEAFETALARVSRRVAVLARESAAQLRAERLAAARSARQGRGPQTARGPRGTDLTRPKSTARPASHRALRTPATEKARASTQAMGDRRQARRDTRRAAAR
jgi:hypothetical protein